MALKPNQLQVTTIKSEETKLWVVNDMLRSFYFENNHDNIEQQEKIIHLITYFNQPHGQL
jgi:hypothetical protein